MKNRYKYLFIIFLFILVGLLYVYPDLRFIFELGKGFQGIPFMGAADETVYLSRIAGVIYKNDLRLANVAIYEHRHDPIYQPFLPEVIEGAIGKVFGLEVWQTDIWITFLFPVILCYMIYLLVTNLTKSFKFGILTTIAIMLGYYWFTPNLKAIFSLSREYFHNALFFSRPINPQFNFIPFMLSLYLIFKVSLKKGYYLAILTGLVIGFLFYVSIYYWTFIYSGLGCLLIVSLFRRKNENPKKYILIFLISILVSIPTWMSLRSLSTSPCFLEIFKRSGGIYTHKPIIPIIEIICLIFLIALNYILKEKREQFYFMISFVSGGLVCLNQQIITARTVQPSHWQFYTNKVFVIICIFVSASFILIGVGKTKYGYRMINLLRKNVFFYVTVSIFLIMGILQQNLFYAAKSGTYRKFQVIAPVLRHIHKELPFGAVILTDPFRTEDQWLFNVFTKNYLYICDSSFMSSSMTSDREIEERYFSALHFFGYTVLEAQDLFKFMDGGLFRGMQVHRQYGGTQEKNNAYIDGLRERYDKFTNLEPLGALKKYKVDYVLLTKKNQEHLLSNSKIADILKLEYADNFYVLYKIKDYG